MPYQTNDDLPVSVRAHLHDHAQILSRSVQSRLRAPCQQCHPEAAARQHAWAAVKRFYVNANGKLSIAARTVELDSGRGNLRTAP